MINSSITLILSILTYFGDAALWVFIALTFYWVNKKRLSITFVTAILTDVIVNKALKYSLMMPRPSNPIIPVEDPYGFPSGHAETAFFVATFLSLNDRRFLPMFILAGTVGYSRVMLRVHYPMDIIGGALIGSLLGVLFYRTSKMKIKLSNRWIILEGLTSVFFGFMCFTFFPVRRALMGGFIAGIGISIPIYSKLKTEMRIRRNNLTKLILGSVSTALIATPYLVTEAPVFKGVIAFFIGTWAFLIYPLMITRLFHAKTA